MILLPGESCLLVEGLHSAPVAELVKLDLPLNLLLVFRSVVITPLANGAAEGNQSVGSLYLCHGEYGTTTPAKAQYFKARTAFAPGLLCFVMVIRSAKAFLLIRPEGLQKRREGFWPL